MKDNAAKIPWGHNSITKPGPNEALGFWTFRCGHCGDNTTGVVLGHTSTGFGTLRWLQCTTCHEPSVVDSTDRQHPGISFGPDLEGLPVDVAEAYGEARRCLAINADVAAEVMCRKILMHVAVEKGATDGKPFTTYIDYLVKQGYVTPPMLPWVDLIRQNGNNANHRLEPRDRPRAERTLMFTAHLLRSVYEMEHLAQKYLPPNAAPPTGP